MVVAALLRAGHQPVMIRYTPEDVPGDVHIRAEYGKLGIERITVVKISETNMPQVVYLHEFGILSWVCTFLTAWQYTGFPRTIKLNP